MKSICPQSLGTVAATKRDKPQDKHREYSGPCDHQDSGAQRENQINLRKGREHAVRRETPALRRTGQEGSKQVAGSQWEREELDTRRQQRCQQLGPLEVTLGIRAPLEGGREGPGQGPGRKVPSGSREG